MVGKKRKLLERAAVILISDFWSLSCSLIIYTFTPRETSVSGRNSRWFLREAKATHLNRLHIYKTAKGGGRIKR